jgi:hypothetical protein
MIATEKWVNLKDKARKGNCCVNGLYLNIPGDRKDK